MSPQLPPQNLEAEQALLGGLLRDPTRLSRVRAIGLTAEDFFRDDHATAFRGICELVEGGAPVDAISFAEWLRKNKFARRKKDVDAFVFELLECVPHGLDAPYHAGIVWGKSVARKLILAHEAGLKDAYSGNFDPEALVSRTFGRIDALRSVTDWDPEDGGEGVEVATLADVERIVGGERWVWPQWIVSGHMTVLAAEPGTGKTRLTLDLCRRVYRGELWPDGAEPTIEPGACSLWVASDRNHAELVPAAKAFGLPPEAVRFNASPELPCGGLRLDDPAEVRMLRRRVRSVRPWAVIIDTINKATRRILYRPEEADAFFAPILDLARDENVAVLALTHLSKGGEPLDRRIEGTCRVLWTLSRPDPDSDARRLAVPKSFALIPPPLGVEMGSEGSTYTDNPPSAPEGGNVGGRPNGTDNKLTAARAWILEQLAFGRVRCYQFFEDGQAAGHTRRTLLRALDALGITAQGPKSAQYYALRSGDGASEDSPEPAGAMF